MSLNNRPSPLADSTHKRVDPDPVTIGLTILSALANVTTVLLYLDGLRRQRLVERHRGIRVRTKNAIRRLRNDLTHLRASADSVFSLMPTDSRKSPFRFGYAPAFLDRVGFDVYQDEYKEILWRIGEIQGRIRRILTDIFDWPDAIVDLPTGALREANSAANRIFEERLTVAEAYDTIQKVIVTMTQQLDDIDDYLSQFGVE